VDAKRPLVANTTQLGDDPAIFHAALANPHLEGIGLGVAKMNMADIRKNLVPGDGLLLPIN
jgi:hypothetical protein